MYGETNMETYITMCKIDQFSHSVMSNSLRPHRLQHARLPCPSPTPGVARTHVYRVSDAQ